MQPQLLTHVKPIEGSFRVWKNSSPYRHNPWHYHPEYELTLIEKGAGTFFVGDHFEPFGNYELVLLGSNLPHEWRSQFRNEDKSSDESSSLAIHFMTDFMGDRFLNLPEVVPLKTLLKNASLGMKFTNKETIVKVQTYINKMLQLTGLKKMICFLDVMECLSSDPSYKLLCSPGFTQTFQNMETEKISIVFQYLMKNFKHEISLAEVSDKTCMTPNAFCRWFKKNSGKTFIEYLNQVRTGYSKKLLQQDNLSVTQIAYEAGFKNISNFNKQFRNIHGITPTEYRATINSKKS